MSKSVFDTLNSIDMKQHIKSVQNQRFIPWSSQWSELLKVYPESWFEVHENEVGDPFTVSTMGIMVKVSVTVTRTVALTKDNKATESIVRTINYPVLDSKNKSMKIEPYEYQTKRGANSVAAATTFDINTAIVRALTKCIALHGLGLYVYQDELQPDPELVDSGQLQDIINKIKENHLVLSEVCNAWQISKIAQLQASNFNNMMKWLEARS